MALTRPVTLLVAMSSSKISTPLIVMSPKSLLRHKLAASSLEDFADGQFHNVIAEIDDIDSHSAKRLVICSGKVYFDLLEARREHQLDHIAIIRLEQLYPFPDAEMFAAIADYSRLDSVVWCQEEPKNQGAWYTSQHRLRRVLDLINKDLPLSFAGRQSSASPAAGYMALHLQQQKRLVSIALELPLE